jgi:hypothetical protein
MIARGQGLAVTITAITSKDIVTAVTTVLTSKDIAKANTGAGSEPMGRIVTSRTVGTIIANALRTAGIIIANTITVVTPTGGNSTKT